MRKLGGSRLQWQIVPTPIAEPENKQRDTCIVEVSQKRMATNGLHALFGIVESIDSP